MKRVGLRNSVLIFQEVVLFCINSLYCDSRACFLIEAKPDGIVLALVYIFFKLVLVELRLKTLSLEHGIDKFCSQGVVFKVGESTFVSRNDEFQGVPVLILFNSSFIVGAFANSLCG